jgi:hypothetical protein
VYVTKIDLCSQRSRRKKRRAFWHQCTQRRHVYRRYPYLFFKAQWTVKMGIRLNYLYLVASFAIGLAVMMLTIPKPRVVLKFPSPDNADSHVYKVRITHVTKFLQRIVRRMVNMYAPSQFLQISMKRRKDGDYVESLNVLSSLHRERFCPSKTMRSGGASKSIWSFMPSDSAPNAYR